MKPIDLSTNESVKTQSVNAGQNSRQLRYLTAIDNAGVHNSRVAIPIAATTLPAGLSENFDIFAVHK